MFERGGTFWRAGNEDHLEVADIREGGWRVDVDSWAEAKVNVTAFDCSFKEDAYQ